MTSNETEIAEFADPVLVVSVNQTYPSRSAYDAARFAWMLSEKKARSIRYVLACKDRQVIGVFAPGEWRRATKENFPEFGMNLPHRLAFVGEEAGEEARERYLHKALPADFKYAGTGMRYAGDFPRNP